MAKFKVGDKVKICKREPIDVFPKWIDYMDEYIGDIATVERITQNGHYQLENILYKWHENWLEHAEFTRDDIREFDIVELKNGRLLQVIHDCVYDNLSLSGYSLNDWEDNLKHYALNERNIVKVYRPADSIPTDIDKWKDLPVVWEREPEVKEMTVEEISKALGYEVKIVKGEK